MAIFSQALDKLKVGLEKSRKKINDSLKNVLILGRRIDENLLEELQDKLISDDVGVKATQQIIEDLRALEEMGTELLACGTCIGYYDLKEKVAAGKISNMFEIASALLGAGKIINP